MNEKVVGRRETGSQQVTVSRRTLMKMLAAAGVVVGVERMLPVKWITPSAKASPGVAPPVYPGTCNEDDFPLNGRFHGHGSLVAGTCGGGNG